MHASSSSNASARPAMPSTLSIPGIASSAGAPSSSAFGDFRWPPLSATGATSALTGGLPPPSGMLAGPQYGSTSALSSYGMGGTHPSALPVTPAYERAAAALSAQVTSGNSFALNLDNEGNPLDVFDPRLGMMDVKGYPELQGYPELFGGETTAQMLHANGHNGPGYSGSRMDAGTSPYGGMSSSSGNRAWQQAAPPSTMGGSSDPAALYDSYHEKVYGGRTGAKESGSALQDGTPQPFLQTRNLAQEAIENSKYGGGGGYNFPTAGSFVASPYDGEGLPTYSDAPSRLGAYDGVHAATEARGSRSAYYDAPYASAAGLYDDGRVRRSRPAATSNGYDGYSQNSFFEHRNGAHDIGANYSYPAGRVSHASIGSPLPASRQGSMLAPSGSFVASPFAEGAPTFDLPPPVVSSSSYAPPPLGMSNFAASGSFVAAPYADGAPTPDMLGVSMFPRMPNGYPDTYASLPPPLFSGAAPLGAGAGFGANSRYGSSFVGFDAEVPGRGFGTGGFGANPQPGSFVAMDNGAGGKPSDSRPLYSALEKNPPSKPSGDDRERRERGDERERREREDAPQPNSKSSMPRAREREGASRTKRKTERRACC